jgi:O-antigen ligase
MELKNVKSNSYDYLFCLLILILPYSLKLPNIIIISLSLFFISDYREYDKIDFKILKNKSFAFLGLLVFYFFCKGLITNTLAENNCALLVPIILVPILFLKIKNSVRILFAIIISVFILSVRAIYGLSSYYMVNHELLPFEGDIINVILGGERPYLGFFSVIGIIAAIELAFKFEKYKYLLFAYSFFIFIFIFLISARISVLTILFLIGLYLAFYIKISFKKKILFFLMLSMTLSIGIISNKNLRERLFITSSINESINQYKLHEPRVIIWGCAYEIASSPEFNFIFGLKSEKELDALYAVCYDGKLSNKDRASFFIRTKLNSHNQFIGSYLTSGIIGFILLLSFFISLIITHRKSYLKISMITALFFFFMVEIVLRRQLGVYFFILVVSIINCYPLSFNQKKTQEEILSRY